MAKIQVLDLPTNSKVDVSNIYSLTDQEIDLIKGGILSVVALPVVIAFVAYEIYKAQ